MTEGDDALRECETLLTGGVGTGVLHWAPADNGPEMVPTMFLMDAEYDPMKFQFMAEDECRVIPGEYRWASLSTGMLRGLIKATREADKMWRDHRSGGTDPTAVE